MARANRVTLLAVGLGLLVGRAAVAAELGPDVEGSHDHPLLRRSAGSTIYEFSQKDLDAARVPQRPDRCAAAEGRVTRALYVYPARSSCLAILRDYEKQLRGLKGEVTTGTELPDACNAWDINGSSVQQWVAAVVSKGPAGGRSYVFVGCTEGAFDTPAGPLLIVDTGAGATVKTETYPSAGAATPPASATPAGPMAAGSAYLRATGMTGGSTAPGHVGWSDVRLISLELGSVGSSAVSTGGGSGTIGREVGVVKDVDGTSDGLIPAALSGALIPEVELHLAENDCSSLSILLKGASVGSLSLSGIRERFGLRFQQAVLSHRPIAGAPCPGETATAATIAAGQFNPLEADTEGQVASGGDALEVFVKVPGLQGDVKDPTHLGWFEAASGSMPVLSVATAVSRAVATVTATRRPFLSVRVLLGSGLPATAAAAARGGKLGTVQLELRSMGASPRTVATWELRGASITAFGFPKGDAVRQAADLQFQFDSVKVTAFRPDGTARYAVDLPAL